MTLRRAGNRLTSLREMRGMSAAVLAKHGGVSRQTIYAIEAGAYVPNTIVALRLARALETSVEELFPLEEEPFGEQRRGALWLHGETPARPGQTVALCQVDEQLIACRPEVGAWRFAPGDGIVADPSDGGRTCIAPFDSDASYDARVLLAGCDPCISVLARHAGLAGVELVLAQSNSSQALAFLKQGLIHIAGTHWNDPQTGESNLALIERMFPVESVCVISYAIWETGLITAPGNPKRVSTVADLARPDVRIANREPGAGSRRLLDSELQRLGIESGQVRGYDDAIPGHLAVALRVHEAYADCAIATRAAAQFFGLEFVPLVTERYDFVVRKRDVSLPHVAAVFDTLTRIKFRRDLESRGGYDTTVAGERRL